MSEPQSPPTPPEVLATLEGPVVPRQMLAPQVLKLWFVSAGIWAAVVLIIGAVAEFFIWFNRSGPSPATIPLGVITAAAVVLLGGVPLLLVPLSYRKWSYAIRAKDVLIESGVIWRVRRSIPRLRVQHVDIKSGPLDRWMGVVQVDLHTAGSLGAVASIPGLAPAAAEELREALVGAGGEDTDGV